MKLRPSVTVLLSALGVLFASAQAGENLIARVEKFGQPRLLTPATDAIDDESMRAIFARPDPGTFFLRYAFGLQRHAKKLLSETQAEQLAAVMQRHTPTHSRWHDERNTLRCKFNEVMWRYSGASEADAPALRRELEDWMRLRMAWTEQEHLAQYRFARAVWEVLTPVQQGKLIAGEWKTYAPQDTGHTRGDATAKIITRALGKPDHSDAFETTAAAWSRERIPMHAAVTDTENRERRIVFAMDLNSEAHAHQAALVANSAYKRLYLAEAEATRRIVQAGYDDPAARCAKAAADAWGEAVKRHSKGASDLINLLQSP